MEDNDVQLQIKKRARRRLVGAVFFVSVVAVVLPMVMDNEPRQVVKDVEIRIPGQDEKPFAPKFAAAPPADAAPAEVAEKPVADLPKSPAPEKPMPAEQPPAVEKPTAATLAPQTVKPAGPPTARVLEVIKDNDKKPEKLVEKAPAKSEKAADKSGTKPEKTPAKAEKPAEKASAKNEKSDKQAAKSDSKADSKQDTKAEEAKRAAAILAGTSDAKPAAKSADAKSGEYLVLIGAFANEANVKALKGKLGEQGVKTFSEPLDTPQGKKIRLRAGPFPNREAAEKALEKMRKIGVAGVVAAK